MKKVSISTKMSTNVSKKSIRLKSGLAILAIMIMSMLLVPLHSASAASNVNLCNVSNTTATPGNLRYALDQGGTVGFICSGTMSLGSTYTITKNTTIDGAGQTITISGENLYRIFYVPQNVTLTLKNLTLIYGDATTKLNQMNSYGGAILNEGNIVLDNAQVLYNYAKKGGAIYTAQFGTVVIKKSNIGGNKTQQGSYWENNNGGAIYMENGMLNVNGSTFMNNTAYFGGAIYNYRGGISINDTVFKDNHTQPTVNYRYDRSGGYEIKEDATGASGGAIASDVQMKIYNSYFDTNTASYAGGALFSNGGTLYHSSFYSNSANDQNGGAVADSGILQTTASTFEGNLALGGEGGAVYAGLGTELSLGTSTFKGNKAGVTGGAVTSRGTKVEMTADLFYNNEATTYGGGVYSTAKTTNLVNSTMNNNSAKKGSNLAIEAGVNAAVLNDSISNDKVFADSSVYSNGFIALKNTIISNTGNATNCAGINIWDGGNNLQFPNHSCGDTIPVKDAKLSPLGNYGGPTMVMMISADSPAIDAGNNAICSGPYVNNLDQLLHVRPTDGNGDGVKACDIGAVERNAVAFTGK